ncbi:MAG TPA: lactate racemase domain-containing protein [Isosphaeraceae bacterium]|nr:lactate racemase domain-containing protein [Isosphaeraceae bacterium]
MSLTARASTPIPWGAEGSLNLQFPDSWPEPDVVQPDLSGPLEDYPGALGAALDAPLGGTRLEDLVGPGMTVAVVVDDPSRWTPVSEALPVVLGRILEAGVRPSDVSISVGVGRHLAVDEESMRRRVGEAVARAYPCYSPPVDDIDQYVPLGETPQGVPVRVFRPVAEANVRVLIGSVLPHLQAGFGGGYKLIFPGTSHRSTLGALHRQGLGEGNAAALLGGDVRENPMRQAIRAAADLLPGPCVSISHLLGHPGQVLSVAAGDVDQVQERLSGEARQRLRAPASAPADVVIAGNHPWPGDPMQSFKVLLNHRASARADGVLVGLFWTDPEEIDRSFPMPALKAIAASGVLGGWVVRRGLKAADRVVSAFKSPSRFMIRWARELVADRAVLVYAPPLYQRLGPRLGPIRIFENQELLWEAVAECLKGRPELIRVFPSGGLTYCPVRDEGERRSSRES